MKERQNKKCISIRNSVLIIFVISLIISAITIGLVVFLHWMSSVKKATKRLSVEMNQEITKEISDFLEIPYKINEVNFKVIKNNIVNIEDRSELVKYFVGVLETQMKGIYSFSYGTETGEYYGARRNTDGDIEFMLNNEETKGQTWYYTIGDNYELGELSLMSGSFDPRTRVWYQRAKRAKGLIYSPIYKHFLVDDLVVSTACSIFDEKGELKGVLGAHMLLSGIDQSLVDIVNENEGIAFIVEKDTEELIANSLGLDNFTVRKDGTIDRNDVNGIEDSTIRKGYEQYKKHQKEHFLVKGTKDGYYFDIKEFKEDGINWLIISALPYSLFMKDISSNIYHTVMILLLTGVVFIIIYYYITNKLMNPINSILRVMERISSGDLTERVAIYRNDEFGKISIMFNQMADKMNHLVDHLETSVQDRTSELVSANEALSRTKEELYLILDSTAEGIFGLDLSGKCTFCNNRCIELLGYQHQSDVIGKNMHSLIHYSYEDGKSLTMDFCKIMSTLKTGESVFVDNEVFWRADGTSFDVEYYSYPQLKDGVLSGAVVTFLDSTERKKSEEQIRYLSYHDALTGLMNRGCFERTVKQYDIKNNLPISILFADVNGLKLVNDVFGHTSGDLLIKTAADILKNTCRNQDVLARVGGDEFIVLLPKTEPKDAQKIIERIQAKLSKKKVNGLACSMALGFDTKTSYYDDIEKIMSSAESEMYRVKLQMRKSFGAETINTIMNSLQLRNSGEKVHSEHIATLCEQMGIEMGLSDPEIKKLRDAGYLHDIGKIVLPDNILKNEKDLTDYERQLKSQHPVMGYRLLNLFDDTLDLADVVFAHHERFDGSGYPKGIKGEEIPLISRIITLAEHYESLVTKELAAGKITKEEIESRIREGAGTSFDPDLVEVFLRMLKNFNYRF